MTSPRTMDVRNVFDPRSTVSVDPYGPNPLGQMMLALPAGQAASRFAPPPRMFQGGTADLPLFTASGIDPQLLMRAPFGQRHGLAAEPDPAKVHGLFEQYSTQPDFYLDHEGFEDAKTRLRTWARTAGVAEEEAQRQANEQDARITQALTAMGANEAALLRIINRSRRQSAIGIDQRQSGD
jgi:hypothetical protein